MHEACGDSGYEGGIFCGSDDHYTEDMFYNFKPGQNFDLPQCSLAICLVLKGAYLLNGHLFQDKINEMFSDFKPTLVFVSLS